MHLNRPNCKWNRDDGFQRKLQFEGHFFLSSKDYIISFFYYLFYLRLIYYDLLKKGGHNLVPVC